MSVADAVLEANVDFQGSGGLSPKIVRKAEAGCCNWCTNLAGVYSYSVENRDVYRRHRDCRCNVEYDPGDGKDRRQNVHSKKWTTAEERAKIEARQKYFGLSLNQRKRFPIHPVTGKQYIYRELNFSDKQIGAKIGSHARDFELNPSVAEDRERLISIIKDIVVNAEERCYGEWRSQEYPVLFHIKGDNVVVESNDGQFITVLRGGVSNARVKNAREQKV